MPGLFDPIAIRGLTIRNRVAMSPMCQYSCFEQDGKATDWHLVHVATHAIGGVGLCIMEASAVESRGRISREDLGIWNDDQIPRLRRIVELGKSHGAAIGIQLAHAGRKAATQQKGHWEERLVGPSAIPFDDGFNTPNALGSAEIEGVVESFAAAARRSADAGFDMVEVHGAHGYLISSFLSPLANKRDDEYGGPIENRARLAVEVVAAVRDAVPDDLPVFIRISGIDFVDGGTTIEDSIIASRMVAEAGADVIDVSGGGNVSWVSPVEMGFPGYQVQHSAAIRAEAGVKTMAVGVITNAFMAEEIVRNERADLVALGRELLRNPYWTLHAARELGVDIAWPEQYEHARL